MCRFQVCRNLLLHSIEFLLKVTEISKGRRSIRRRVFQGKFQPPLRFRRPGFLLRTVSVRDFQRLFSGFSCCESKKRGKNHLTDSVQQILF